MIGRTMIVAAVALALVGLGGCKAPAPAPKPKPGAYVPLLAALSKNPQAQKPTSTKVEKTTTTFAYADSPGIKTLTLVVAKDRPNAWRLTFASTGGKFQPGTFSDQASTKSELPLEWFEIQSGPLKGAVVHLPASDATQTAEVFGPAFFLSPVFEFQEPQMITWACDTGAGGKKAAMTMEQFKSKCSAAAPPGNTVWYPSTATAPSDCTHALKGDGYTCTETKKGGVEFHGTKS